MPSSCSIWQYFMSMKWPTMGPAIALIDEVLQLRPDEFQFRKIFIEILILAEEYDRAEGEIAKLRDRDWADLLQRPDAEIERLAAGFTRAA